MISIINLAGAHYKNSLTNHFMGNRKKSERNYIEELVDVMEYLVVLKREVYTLKQLKELYTYIKGVGLDSI